MTPQALINDAARQLAPHAPRTAARFRRAAAETTDPEAELDLLAEANDLLRELSQTTLWRSPDQVARATAAELRRPTPFGAVAPRPEARRRAVARG